MQRDSHSGSLATKLGSSPPPPGGHAAAGSILLLTTRTLLQRGATLSGDADARATTEARSVILHHGVVEGQGWVSVRASAGARVRVRARVRARARARVRAGARARARVRVGCATPHLDAERDQGSEGARDRSRDEASPQTWSRLGLGMKQAPRPGQG